MTTNFPPNPSPRPTIPPLRHATLSNLHHALSHHSVTPTDLVQAYTHRIHETNSQFHAVIQLNPTALADAHTLNHTPHPATRLHGIPILLKDNIPTLDATNTTCGSLALVGARPASEAAVVTALRRAGAIVLGKANMAQWSGFRSTSGCSGWSARGGQGVGVYCCGMKASGSSGGCAVGVALGLCGAAVGTETCYSIVSPAEKAGVVGFKPTRGLISSEGIIGASKRLDTVGFLTRCVEDAVTMVVAVVCQSEHLAPVERSKAVQGIAVACLKIALSGVRIGVPWNLSDLKTLHRDKFEPFKRALDALECAGATIVHNVIISGAEEYEALSPSEKQIILDTDMKIAINSYLSSLTTNPQNIHDLRDLIEFTKSCPGEEYPHRNVEGLERAQATDADDELYQSMLAKDEYFAGEGGIDGALNRHECNVLLIPTLSVTLQTFAAKAGSPVMSVPMGSFAEGTEVEVDAKNGLVNIAPGIPFSAYIFGRAASDEDVLKVGYVLEQMVDVGENLVPYLEPTTEVVDVQSS
ncbi:amidase signature domain-containing protein [Ampelomyces quisqualis]|uniref:Amidase signature domain-containing protein n=1 Tax=Ampelomyces quisqualis TaxID=50730 RepID=A0A6A5R4R1_AMPQU|nr:amidase signature domain-containing protein [Ampelomyces quisqualis]